MNQTIPIKDIKIHDRMRKDLGDLTGLSDSIKRHGLIEPIVLDHDHNLIAGERRTRAAMLAGLTELPFVYRDQVSSDTKAEIEFDENYWRKSMSWQEECLGILNIYRKKKLLGTLRGFNENWQLTVSQMFGMSIGTINYVLIVAQRLEAELSLPEDKRRYHKFSNASQAYQLGILREESDRLEARMAEMQRQRTASTAQRQAEAKLVEEISHVVEAPTTTEVEVRLADAKARYESNPHNTIPFEQYWAKKQTEASEIRNTVYLSNHFFHCDCIEFMNDPDNESRFDHILTDPPYGIDMDHLDQNGMGIVNLDRVIDQHQVESNLQLFRKFFPAAWKCTKEHSFVVLCCDIDNWELLKSEALAAGFAVQRWPYLWRKVNQSVKNQCPQFNSTKDYEPIMVCRKPATAVAERRNTSFSDCGNTIAVRETGHPFAKPYELTRDLCQWISLKGQCILDPFMGGGAMAVQMLRMERIVVGCEIEEHHYNSALTNIKNLHYLKLNPNFIFA